MVPWVRGKEVKKMKVSERLETGFIEDCSEAEKRKAYTQRTVSSLKPGLSVTAVVRGDKSHSLIYSRRIFAQQYPSPTAHLGEITGWKVKGSCKMCVHQVGRKRARKVKTNQKYEFKAYEQHILNTRMEILF